MLSLSLKVFNLLISSTNQKNHFPYLRGEIRAGYNPSYKTYDKQRN